MLLDYCKKIRKNIYVFGLNERAIQIIRFLNKNDISVAGIVQSDSFLADKNNKCHNIDIPIKKLSQLDAEDTAIIIGVKYRHYNDVIPELIRRGIADIYFLSGRDKKSLLDYDVYSAKEGDLDTLYGDREETYYSAKVIFSYLKKYGISVKSAIEFGCGCGSFLKALKNVYGNIEVLGVDGSDVDRSGYLEQDEFLQYDLTKYTPEKKYDLAISVEVAEHLDEEYAENFVKNICLSADTVLFSAAIKWQGGDHHVNEQYPSYWCNIFEKFNYYPIDCIRPEIWKDEKIPVWYRQNCILYTCKHEMINKFPECGKILDIVHPIFFDGVSQAIYKGDL